MQSRQHSWAQHLSRHSITFCMPCPRYCVNCRGYGLRWDLNAVLKLLRMHRAHHQYCSVQSKHKCSERAYNVLITKRHQLPLFSTPHPAGRRTSFHSQPFFVAVIYWFIFGCPGSSLLCTGFSLWFSALFWEAWRKSKGDYPVEGFPAHISSLQTTFLLT